MPQSACPTVGQCPREGLLGTTDWPRLKVGQALGPRRRTEAGVDCGGVRGMRSSSRARGAGLRLSWAGRSCSSRSPSI